jgi:hypothetical protein
MSFVFCTFPVDPIRICSYCECELESWRDERCSACRRARLERFLSHRCHNCRVFLGYGSLTENLCPACEWLSRRGNGPRGDGNACVVNRRWQFYFHRKELK